MKKAELIFTGILVFALLLGNFTLIPGGAILMILSLSALSMLYFYLGFLLFNDVSLANITKKDAYKHISKNRIIGSILTGVALAIMLMGILFKAQRWPGAAIMLLYGLVFLFAVGVVALIQYSRGKSPFYSGVLKRVVPYFVIGVFLYFFSDFLFLDFKYRNYPAYIQAVKALREDPRNDSLYQIMEDERYKMRYPDYKRPESK